MLDYDSRTLVAFYLPILMISLYALLGRPPMQPSSNLSQSTNSIISKALCKSSIYTTVSNDQHDKCIQDTMSR